VADQARDEYLLDEYIEVWGADAGRQVVGLDAPQLTVGRDPGCDVAVPTDPTLSRVHALLEAVGRGWCVRDLGSANGTYCNGERLTGERTLRSDDELRMGKVRVVFHAATPARGAPTEVAEPPPLLTPREQEVLVALCRPVLAADVFTEPASIKTIADRLLVTEAAVKQHLGHLYDKFGVPDGLERRRVRLANEAVRRGAVSLGHLRQEAR
jgi:hypothetical protein